MADHDSPEVAEMRRKLDEILSEPSRYTRAAVDRLRKFGDVTPNGVVFDWELVSAEGASFVLVREPHHGDVDIDEAKRYLRGDRDVVRLSVENFNPAE